MLGRPTTFHPDTVYSHPPKCIYDGRHVLHYHIVCRLSYPVLGAEGIAYKSFIDDEDDDDEDDDHGTCIHGFVYFTS